MRTPLLAVVAVFVLAICQVPSVAVALDTNEPNNTIASATSISVPTILDSYISTANDVDMYKVYLNAGNIRFVVDPPADYSLYVSLANEGGSEVADGSSYTLGNQVEVTYSVTEPGYYYLSVEAHYADYSSTNAYRLIVNVPLDTNEPNNTVATATSISVPTTLDSYLSTANDVDMYKLYLNAGNIRFLVDPPVDYSLYVSLANEGGSEVADGSSYTLGNQVEVTYSVTEPGYYYLSVEAHYADYSSTNAYRLIVNVPLDTNEPNNTRPSATPVVSAGDLASYLSTANDVDMYKLYLNAGNIRFLVDPPVDYSLYVSLANEGGSEVADGSSYTLGNQVEVTYSVTEPGYYYLSVEAHYADYSSANSYRLTVDGTNIAKLPVVGKILGPSELTLGDSGVLSVGITSDGTYVSGIPLRIEALPLGASAWTAVVTMTSGSSLVTYSVSPTTTTEYRTVFVGNATYRPATSAALTLSIWTPPVDTTTLIATGSRTLAAYGSTFMISGNLTSSGVPLADQSVILQASANGSMFFDTGYFSTTGSDGAYSFSVVPTTKTYYRVRFDGSTGYSPSFSATSVYAVAVPYVGTPVAPSSMSHSRYYTIYGYLKPRHTSGSYPVRIYKYRYVSGHWKSYGYESARATNYYSYTKYSRSIKLPYKGRWRVRAYAPADSGHAATWSSGYDYITVK